MTIFFNTTLWYDDDTLELNKNDRRNVGVPRPKTKKKQHTNGINSGYGDYGANRDIILT